MNRPETAAHVCEVPERGNVSYSFKQQTETNCEQAGWGKISFAQMPIFYNSPRKTKVVVP